MRQCVGPGVKPASSALHIVYPDNHIRGLEVCDKAQTPGAGADQAFDLIRQDDVTAHGIGDSHSAVGRAEETGEKAEKKGTTQRVQLHKITN